MPLSLSGSDKGSIRRTMSDVLKNPKFCAKCGAPDCALKYPCKQSYYRSKKCQKADWDKHKTRCAIALSKEVKDARREHGREDASVADARMEAGVGHIQQGRHREAEKCILEARRVYVAAYGDGHEKIGRVCFELGQLYENMGRCDESL